VEKQRRGFLKGKIRKPKRNKISYKFQKSGEIRERRGRLVAPNCGAKTQNPTFLSLKKGEKGQTSEELGKGEKGGPGGEYQNAE